MNHKRLLLVALFLLTSVSASAAGPSPPTRCAIVVSPYLETSGLLELLTVRLSSLDGVTLLEREQMDQLAKELELSALFDAPKSPRRLALGRTLGADRLIAIDTRHYRSPRQTKIRLLVLDMATGSRLHHSEYPLDENDAEKACQYCVTVMQDMLVRFKHGVHAVVAVPRFISKSLDPQWKQLETEYAQLIEHTLQSVPGIAVVPMEEARLIEQELETAPKDLQRLTPLVLEGEFTVPFQEASEAADSAPVRIKLTLSNGRRELQSFCRQDFSLDQVPQFLAEQVVPALLEHIQNDGAAPLSLAEQKAALLRRAARFRDFNDHRTALTLTRSALLLTPLDVELRLDLLKKTYAREAQLHEVEFLINHRLINMLLAIELCEWCVPYSEKHLLQQWREMAMQVGPHITSLSPAKSYEDARAGVAGISGFPVGPERVSQYYAVGMWLAGLNRNIGQGRRRTELLPVAQIMQIFDQIPGEHQGAVAVGMTNTGSPYKSLMRALKDRLEGCKDPLSQFADAKLTLCLCRYDSSRKDKLPTAAEVDRLEAMLDKFCAANPGLFPKTVADGQRIYLRGRRRELAALSREQTPPSQRPKQHHQYCFMAVARLAHEEPIRIDAEFSVEPIDGWRYPVEYDTRNIGRRNFDAFPKTRLVKLNEHVDIVWDRQAVFVLEMDGNGKPVFREIFAASPDPEKPFTDTILQVRGDGEKLWMATGARGILVMSTEGQILAQFGADSGLPGYCCNGVPEVIRRDREIPDALSDFSDGMTETAPSQFVQYSKNGRGHHSVRLTVFPVDKGHALAIGRLGPPLRTWVALLSLEHSAGGPQVQVLHETSRHRLSEDPAKLALEGGPRGLDLVFEPPWICLYEDPADPQERVAIVGRWLGHHWNTGGDANTPLAIDLNTLQVSALGDRLPQFAGVRGGLAARCMNGSMVVVNFDKTEAWVRKENGDYDYVLLSDRATQNRFLIPWKNAIYCPGVRWLRIDLGDHPGQVTEVANMILPPQHELNRYAASAHYKIWGDYDSATRDQAYRIDPEKETHVTLSPFARYVPPDKLDRHDRAVEAIRDLGGIVERSDRHPYPNEPLLGIRLRVPKGHTMVLLTDQWKGGDEGLAHLRDLHALRTLYIHGASLTDRAAASLNELVDIEYLFLIDTDMTTRAISAMTDLKQIQALHLEGKQGTTSFGDDTLEVLQAFPKLSALSIYGAGFTGEGVPALAGLPSLNHLRVLDTRLSLEDCDRLRKLKKYPVRSMRIRSD